MCVVIYMVVQKTGTKLMTA